MKQDDKRIKFEKEFSQFIKNNNELKNFSMVFEDLKKLWH